MVKMYGLLGVALAAGLSTAPAANAAVALPECLEDVTVGPEEVTLTFGGGQGQSGDFSFKVEYLGNEGNTFSYKVTELSRDLSHFNVLLGECLGFVTGTSSGAEIGEDGSTGTTGIKWDLTDGFSEGTFSFTLDPGVEWVLGTITVLTKAGPGFETAEIAGPQCCGDEPGTVIPTPAAAGAGLGLLALSAIRRGRRGV